MSKLTDKQRVFCEEYLIDLNATQAAIRAGYSKKTASVTACENLTKPNVQEYLQELQAARSERTEITADYVLNTIKETVDEARADRDRNSTLRGCELLGKHLKLFTDKMEFEGKLGMSIEEFLEQEDEQQGK